MLIIADDIDRLQADELLALLKVVRLLGRFPGVRYLLAYDETTLFTALGHTDLVRGDTGAAQRFMEKIVQYPLVVPSISSRQLVGRLEVGLDAVLMATGRQRPTSNDRLSNLYDVVSSVFSTPRTVDRFLAQLHHHLPLVIAEDVHTDDVIVLTMLRVAFPRLYEQLPRWRDELTSGHTREMLDYPEHAKAVPFDIKPLVSCLPESWRRDAERLVRDLFPALPTPGPEFRLEPSPRSVSDKRYFDRYFTMSVPDHDVSDLAVGRAVEAVEDGQAQALLALLEDSNAERVGLVIDKAHTTTSALGENDPLRLALLGHLIPRMNNWPESQGMFTNLRLAARRWKVDLLLGLSDAVKPAEIIDRLSTAPSLSDQAGLVYRARRTPALEPPSWFPAVAAALCKELAAALVANISMRDDAPVADQPGWLVTVLSSLDDAGTATRRLITEGLKSQNFTLADVAARFVTVELGDDAAPGRIVTVRSEEFAALVPPITDDWYDYKQAPINSSDLSWANRRAAAAGRFEQPTGSA